jgi:hypothetical protein
MHLSFERSHVEALLTFSETMDSHKRKPMLADLANADFWRDDLSPDRKKKLSETLAQDEFAFFEEITYNDFDFSKLPTGLFLIANEGVYLTCQASNKEVRDANIKPAAYALEANPESMDADEVRDAKRHSFGEVDGAEFLPAAEVRSWIDSHPDDLETLTIDVSPEAISLLVVERALGMRM